MPDSITATTTPARTADGYLFIARRLNTKAFPFQYEYAHDYHRTQEAAEENYWLHAHDEYPGWTPIGIFACVGGVPVGAVDARAIA